ncbi:MAG: Clp protease ClpP [Faecalicatena sp.]|uniref:head maturation protease, ClpP-related n=1 Tax=Faecalicatena sp. TaxID=2005360 RepID=UPI00258E5BD7|nr:head maturation protease, ClpP-related [Faecalicatena sp.]MCI6466390.1 Clp protease ClpP [Faecalicatena sp.]MCI7182361.1 Clp protease ClpP [Lachnospiraceae bacterium]MDY5619016.1 Clp protease ClpP [Lachnospiraceae bacterium]
MKHRVDIRGVLIPNDYKWFYDWFGEESTCPKDVQDIVGAAVTGDEIEVYISSPGGVIDVGSEIYTLLRSADNVKIYITGEACSAASIIAMAGYCEMSPTALMMVHCVSSGTKGNHSDMEHMAEVLRTADRALSTAYTAKTGMTEAEILEMMERETWLTAEQAKEQGLIDAIMFEEVENNKMPMVAGPLFALPSTEQMEKARKMIRETDVENETSVFLLQQKLNLLKMRGEVR